MTESFKGGSDRVSCSETCSEGESDSDSSRSGSLSLTDISEYSLSDSGSGVYLGVGVRKGLTLSLVGAEKVRSCTGAPMSAESKVHLYRFW